MLDLGRQIYRERVVGGDGEGGEGDRGRWRGRERRGGRGNVCMHVRTYLFGEK